MQISHWASFSEHVVDYILFLSSSGTISPFAGPASPPPQPLTRASCIFGVRGMNQTWLVLQGNRYPNWNLHPLMKLGYFASVSSSGNSHFLCKQSITCYKPAKGKHNEEKPPGMYFNASWQNKWIFLLHLIYWYFSLWVVMVTCCLAEVICIFNHWLPFHCLQNFFSSVRKRDCWIFFFENFCIIHYSY